jgi:tRNA dimethylallyltransferase
VTLSSQSSAPIIVLVGPTAIGKTALSLEIASLFNCEIVSVDSMQVYRYMDIGTAKATRAERAAIPHHLIDIVDPDEQYDAARFVDDANAAIALIREKKKIPLLTGGTGLYLKAFTDGIFTSLPIDAEIRDELKKRLENEGLVSLYSELSSCDPLSARRIHGNDGQRILRALEIYQSTGISWAKHLQIQAEEREKRSLHNNMLQIGLTCDRQLLYERINGRCRQMLDVGLEQEVYDLFSRGFGKQLPSLNAIGYRHMVNYIEDKWTIEETFANLARDTRRYAKRQYTWFNGIKTIEWYHREATKEILTRITGWLI